jgi:lycopene cyclase-like protein
MGIRRLRVLDRERCVIPLGIAPPRRDQRIVAFGAAAGMVHPASGYQLARALASAPEVARAIAEGRTPHEAALRAYDVVWPASRLRAWDLFTFGMETLCRLDTSGTRAFFEAFFSLPPETTLRFLRAELGPASIAAAMARMLVVAGPRLRRELLRFPPSERRAMARALSLVAS